MDAFVTRRDVIVKIDDRKKEASVMVTELITRATKDNIVDFI